VLESGFVHRNTFDSDPNFYIPEPHVECSELEPIPDCNDPNFPQFRLGKCKNLRNCKIALETLFDNEIILKTMSLDSDIQ
jgi:hypothetical protein